MSRSWMETAVGRGKPSRRCLGEDEYGVLCVPSRTRPDWWDRPFDPRNPLHWRFWLWSRLTRSIVFLEMTGGEQHG